MSEEKRRLRKVLSDRRNRVPPDLASAAARAVASLVCAEPRVRGAGRIGLYASRGGELPTRPIFDALGSVAGEVCLPRVRGRAIEWLSVELWEDLAPGRFGILEPPGDRVVILGPGDVVLLPGLAFDRQGWRLGRGGGYFDRAFPADVPAPWLIGVGYAFQRVDSVPHDSRDRRVDAIVSEEGWVLPAEAR